MNKENQNLSSPLDSFPDAEVAHHPSNPQGDHLRKLWSSEFCKIWKLLFSKFCKSSPSGSHQFSLQAAWLVNLKQKDLFICPHSYPIVTPSEWGYRQFEEKIVVSVHDIEGSLSHLAPPQMFIYAQTILARTVLLALCHSISDIERVIHKRFGIWQQMHQAILFQGCQALATALTLSLVSS